MSDTPPSTPIFTTVRRLPEQGASRRPNINTIRTPPDHRPTPEITIENYFPWREIIKH